MADRRPHVNGLLQTFLKAEGVSTLDFTGPIHGLKYKFPLYLRPGGVIGVVMHNTSGLIALPNLVGTWKSKEPNPPPSHLAISRSGEVGFYVKLEYADRATEHTNKHLSIEFVAVENGDITRDQIETAGLILAFAKVAYNLELAVANGRTQKGLAHHSLFVDPGNPQGHFNCPGLTMIGRKDDILDKAKAAAPRLGLLGDDEPAGLWDVQVGEWTWIYTFDANGGVTWKDPYNGMSGPGTWVIRAGSLVFSWTNSKTTESWDLPLKARGQTGKTRMKGIDYEVKASRR